MDLPLEYSYASLPASFYVWTRPLILDSGTLTPLVLNENLAAELGLADYNGVNVPKGATPLAMAYAGHQFGNFVMLGDGRAVLLGEYIAPYGRRFDIHWKGAGPTVFARGGDGLAVLGPMLREYLISEAMAALGIPTTRSLCVAVTGTMVRRQTLQPGATLVRVAQSHLRVGTFQFAAEFTDASRLRALADYTISRHYQELLGVDDRYLRLLQAVGLKQVELIAKWQAFGFVHGVMNTDNMAISGETIDYGPCAFMDRFDLGTVFSSIDRDSRYAYGQQPGIMLWNLTRFAETLLPLLDPDQTTAIKLAEDVLKDLNLRFRHTWVAAFAAKIGVASEDLCPSDEVLIADLLKIMQTQSSDFTATFTTLTETPDALPAAFSDWLIRWQARSPNIALMRMHNPRIIPRNLYVEQALARAVEHNDLSMFHRLLAAVSHPFSKDPQFSEFSSTPAYDLSYRTFCGT